MKRKLFNAVLLTAACAVSLPSLARESVKNGGTAPKASYKTEAGDCASPTANFDLDINNVRAKLLTGGDMWWNLSDAKYEVPKGNGTGAPLNAIFSGSIWISGKDAGQNLKVAAVRYRQLGDDFWPGPLVNNSIDRATCNKYDRFFNVYGADISKAQGVFLDKGSATAPSDIPKSVLSWPGKGNPYIATDPTLLGETFIVNDNLAPFKDVDGDGVYDPVKGDYPIIPCRGGEAEAYGDQMIFWVFNDMGNLHTESNGQAIGVQVNALAFAFQTTDEVNNMTFYKYEIINKSPNPLYDTYVSQNVDPDLGCFDNDAIGCDTARSLGICYNHAAIDAGCSQGITGYGSQLPMVGVDFFEGPIGDQGQQLGMSSFIYYTNGATVEGDPMTASQYRNYQEGKFSDGTPITWGGNGLSGSVPTHYVYPSNPVDPTGWSEETASIPPGDRRFVQSSGPFTLKPGVSQYVTVGVVFVRPPGGVGNPPNFETQIGPADDLAQSLFNTCFKLVDGPDAPDLKIREMSNQLIINLENSKASNNFGEGYDQADGKIALIVNSQMGGRGDSTYTFEGYKLYQVANPNVSATDLDDPDKARQVAIVDVKNGVSKIINFVKDPTLGDLYVPYLKTGGSNDAGITTTFNITTDLFAKGSDNQLVNHKTYYFTAVAYAYNNYLQYDPQNPAAGGQLTPYLQGGKNFKIYSAIPHEADPRNEGTQLNSKWGDGVEVKRIEGQGNGGNVLNLTPQTIQNILSSGSYAFADTLTYQKGYDPIGFKVTDPISLREGDYELRFLSDSFFDVEVMYLPQGSSNFDTAIFYGLAANVAQSSSQLNNMLPAGSTIFNVHFLQSNNRIKWQLKDFTTNVVINSDRYLDRPYEQHIADSSGDYGFLIKLGTPVAADSINGKYLATPTSPARPVYGVSQSSIEYQNPTERWLSFVADQGTASVQNWIRSGTDANDPSSQSMAAKNSAEVFDGNYYFWGVSSPPANAYEAQSSADAAFQDPQNIFDKILGGTWAPYCLTAAYSKKNLTKDEQTSGKPPFVFGPGFKWKDYAHNYSPQNTLDRLASVDVVITPDKSKWSRCVVFETGEDDAINEGQDISPNGKASRKGQIRMHRSKRWHDPIARDYLEDDPMDIGRSWFPGYAINIETGERLNIAFGESSDMGDQNGRDMLWDPTDKLYNPITFPNAIIPQLPYFGGKHFIYVMDTKYDEGDTAHQLLTDNFANIQTNSPFGIAPALQPLYRSLMWTSIPYLTQGYSFVADQNGVKYIPPAEVTIKLRVEKPYDRFATISTSGDSLPRYQFSTKGMGATEKNQDVAKNALDDIRIVPNPYLAYSEYETDANTNTIKITNLPNVCNITIYSLDGAIIRKLSRSIGVDPATNKRIEISDGGPIDQINVESTIDWDLKNDKGIPISSGIYLFHIEAPGIGQRTLKWFGALRPTDSSSF